MEKTDLCPVRVSVFKGFSKPAGDVTLLEILGDIAGEKYFTPLSKLRLLLGQGRVEEAARVKRQLHGFTLSALYRNTRTAEGLTAYNDILVLDFDKLDETELLRCRGRITELPGTLFCFRSPSGNGLKAGVHFRSPEADRLRTTLYGQGAVSVCELETYHKRMFELCRRAYEEHCGAPIDPSGSDIGRLCFVSHDPEIFIHRPAIDELRLDHLRLTGGNVPLRSYPAGGAVSARPNDPAGSPAATATGIAANGDPSPLVRMEFQRCVNSVNRTMRYTHGQRNTYLYTLGNKCYSRGIPQEDATRMAGEQFGGETDIDVIQVIGNAYHYTGQTDRRKQEEKKPTGIRTLELLETLYEARRNIVLETLEFRPRGGAAKSPNDVPDSPCGREGGATPWRLIREEDYNNMYLDAITNGINCQPRLIHTVVNSRFARDYNPFEDYFYNLPPWDGQTDHIDRLAGTLQTNHGAFWHDCLKRWIVGLVACALDDDHENQLALIIKGEQGKGKSTWIRHLLPPQLKQYYRNGALNPGNRDHMILLSQRLLINLEEFEGMKSGDIADLKRLISQDNVTERKAYGKDTGFYIRRASFIASTNEPRFLEDITGTRRFPTVTAEAIDYHTPVDHGGVYAQALHLWRSGFRYWYEEAEFPALGTHNMQYVIASQEEELFHLYFRAPQAGDQPVKWMSASAILSRLALWGKILSNRQTLRALIKVLEKSGLHQRETAKGIVEYEVFFIGAGAEQS